MNWHVQAVTKIRWTTNFLSNIKHTMLTDSFVVMVCFMFNEKLVVHWICVTITEWRCKHKNEIFCLWLSTVHQPQKDSRANLVVLSEIVFDFFFKNLTSNYSSKLRNIVLAKFEKVIDNLEKSRRNQFLNKWFLTLQRSPLSTIRLLTAKKREENLRAAFILSEKEERQVKTWNLGGSFLKVRWRQKSDNYHCHIPFSKLMYVLYNVNHYK